MRRPRLFQFSLKTLLLMVLVVGSFCGWLGIQLKWKHDRHAELQWIQKHCDPFGIARRSPPPTVPFGLRIVGEMPLDYIPIDANTMYQEDCSHLKEVMRLFPEAQVAFQGKVSEGEMLTLAISMLEQMVAGRTQTGN
jgi:hypothetical protein